MLDYLNQRVSKFQAGNLKMFITAWENYTRDAEVLSTVSGMPVELSEYPFELQNSKQFEQVFSTEEEALVQAEISKLLSKGVVVESVPEEGEIISPIFLTPKPDGSFRMILNLKKLNKLIPYVHFKMDTLCTVLSLIRPNCYMAKVDIKDAYYSVPILEEHQKFLKFRFKGKLYKYVCLPNGLSSGPRKFTKLLKPPLSAMRKLGTTISAYIDDLFLSAITREECHQKVLKCVEILDSLGFVVHPDKSQFSPSKEMEYLGFLINSETMTVKLTRGKILKLQKLCETILQSQKPTIRNIAQLLGVITSSLPAVMHGQLHYRALESCKIEALNVSKGKFDKPMSLSKEAKEDIIWWHSNISTAYNTIYKGNPSVTLTTDACKTGWGAVCRGKKTNGLFSREESDLHINILELKAVMFGLKVFCSNFSNTHIKLLIDNTTAVFTLNKMGSCKSPECNDIVKEIWEWAIKRGIWLTAGHIPGILNVEADEESRKNEIKTEWKLNVKTFNKILNHFNFEPSIDLFASRINTQLQKFVSYRPDPEASAVNAFSFSWEDILWYAFPPFSCVSRAMQKIYMDRTSGILVVPNWPNQPWYSTLMDLTIDEPLLIPSSRDQLVLPNQPQLSHPLHSHLELLACLVCSRDGVNYLKTPKT